MKIIKKIVPIIFIVIFAIVLSILFFFDGMDYHLKRNLRPKDIYDAKVIKEYVDMEVVKRLDTERQLNYNVTNIPASGSIVEQLDSIIRNQDISQEVSHQRL